MIQRVVTATLNYDHPQRGMNQAFQGIFGPGNVVDFDYLGLERQGVSIERINSEFYAQCMSLRPDWIWLQVQDSPVLKAETMLSLRHQLPDVVITHWTGDARPTICDSLADMCKATNVTFASSVGGLGAFRSAGAKRAEYLQIGLDWEEDVLGFPQWEPPFKVPRVVFIGSNYKQIFPGSTQREEAIRALQRAKIDVGVVGNGWDVKDWPCVGTCKVKQQHHVWRKALVGLSINNYNELESYYSDRQLISMASGTPIVCYAVPGLEREFVDRRHCMFYRTTDELVRAVGELLGDPALRRSIGHAGRHEVIQHHTWFSRVLQALTIVEEERDGRSDAAVNAQALLRSVGVP